jgi:hypothetical protein
VMSVGPPSIESGLVAGESRRQISRQAAAAPRSNLSIFISSARAMARPSELP